MGSGGAHLIIGVSEFIRPRLRLAKASDHRAGKGPSGSRGRIPLELVALMLMSGVERALTGWCTAAGLSAGGSVESRLLACKDWAEANGHGEALTTLAGQCAAWVEAITGMLNPLPRVEIKGACPNCFESHVSEINEDGERLSVPSILPGHIRPVMFHLS